MRGRIEFQEDALINCITYNTYNYIHAGCIVVFFTASLPKFSCRKGTLSSNLKVNEHFFGIYLGSSTSLGYLDLIYCHKNPIQLCSEWDNGTAMEHFGYFQRCHLYKMAAAIWRGLSDSTSKRRKLGFDGLRSNFAIIDIWKIKALAG